MSVTVEDLLKLPSLKEARVLGGVSALKSAVTSISVLEYAMPGQMLDQLYETNSPYMGSELCITSFASVSSDVEAQCINLRYIAQCGEVGVILYYVGVILPRVDERLIALADELGVALIVMPEGRMDMRYSDVITEVMETIVRDRMAGSNLVTEIIERMSHLPAHQQTVDTALRMICQRLQVTAALTSADLQPLGEAVWPHHASSVLQRLTPQNVPRDPLVPRAFEPVPGSHIWYAPISTEQGASMCLYLISEHLPLREEQVRMAAETVQLSVDLWSRRHGEPVSSELVRAILRDEPIKMRRLADVLGIDIASIHTMWVLRPAAPDERLPQEAAASAQALLSGPERTVLADLYAGRTEGAADLVLFFNHPGGARELESVAGELVEQMGAFCPGGVTLTMYHYLRTTADVRESYRLWSECEPDMRVIQPGRRIFRGPDVELARRCRETIRFGEHSVSRASSVFDALYENKCPAEYRETLAVFLLDADANVQKTADLLFLHKNTVQYRLRKMSDCLGFPVGEMPSSLPLYLALALERLLRDAQ